MEPFAPTCAATHATRGFAPRSGEVVTAEGEVGPVPWLSLTLAPHETAIFAYILGGSDMERTCLG